MSNTVGFGTEVLEFVPDAKDAPFLSDVYTRADGKGYVAFSRSPGGSQASPAKTLEEANARLAEMRKFREDFWLEKVRWHENGDRTDRGEHCLRINGKHFVAKPGERGHGFGGRRFVWQDLTTLQNFESSNVWHQGDIPPEFRDRLPDNAVWLENTSAVG